MKLSVALICLSVAVAAVSAENGQYIPKGFYTIDGDGNASPMAYLTESHKDVLRRFRRSPGVVSSSSSISSFNAPGQPPVFFQQSGTFNDGGGRGPVGQITTGVSDQTGNIKYTQTRFGGF